MHPLRPLVAILCILLIAGPGRGENSSQAPAQNDRQQSHEITEPSGGLTKITRPYRAKEVPPVNLSNSNRLDSLLRAGKLYLSLQDVIALALENNLDIEIQRYGPQIADTGVLRAQAGGFSRGVNATIQQGPTSAAGGGLGGTGAQFGANVTGINSNAAQQATNVSTSTVGNTLVTQTGSVIPNLDPAVVGFYRWAHDTTPQSSAFITGANAFIQDNSLSNFGIQKGFLTGTTVNLGYSNSSISTNNRSADFNPSTTATLSLTVTQRLLQGFGRAVNSRQIRIAKNNREVSDLVFKHQVITTVAAIMNLYWDLVSFNEQVRVSKQALELAEKLHSDNRKQVEIGTLAPIEVVRADAEVAARQQDLTIAETQVLQQETILKNALSRNGIATPVVADARINPTDRIRMPDVEPIAPMQDMVATALSGRPELAQSRIQIQNSKISIQGSRSALLPQLDLVGSVGNNGLIGTPSDLPLLPGRPRFPDGFFIGGYNTLLSQIFARNFPDYSIGFNLNIPLRNRAAQADMVNDQLTMRQQELSLQRLENQVRVEVQNAVIGLQQARARYQAAVKGRVLQEQTVDAEQKKFALGASTIYNVILTQRDLAQAQSAEVAAMSTYTKARVESDRATGQLLNNNNVSLTEAFRGAVARPPDPIPAVDPR